MDSDPKLWTPEQVQSFWKHDAALLFQDQRHNALPPLDPLLELLETTQIDGSELLENVTQPTIESIYGAGKFREVMSIMRRINVLKQKSQDFAMARVQDQTGITNLPTPTFEQIQLPKRPLSPDSTSSANIAADPTDQSVEVRPSKKRRRIQITNTVPHSFATAESPRQSSARRHEDTPKMSCNDIFFGNTETGQEINHGASAESSKTDQDSNEDISFYGVADPAHSVFVNRRMRYFLTKAPQLQVVRGGQEATAVIPYPIDKTSEPCAMVHQTKDGEDIVTRENVVFTTGGMIITTHEHIASNDPLAELRARHLTAEDESLDLDNATDDASSMMDEDDDESGSDLAEVEEEHQNLPIAEVRRIIFEEYIQKIGRTQDRLANADRAKVWNRSRGNKHDRRTLIHQSEHRIRHLLDRIVRQEEHMLRGTYLNHTELKYSFGAVEPTVEDIEEEKWKISIWQNKQAPQAVASRQRIAAKTTSHNVHSTMNAHERQDHSTDDFVVSDEEEEMVEVTVLSSDDDIDMQDAEQSPTPQAPRSNIVKLPMPKIPDQVAEQAANSLSVPDHPSSGLTVRLRVSSSPSTAQKPTSTLKPSGSRTVVRLPISSFARKSPKAITPSQHKEVTGPSSDASDEELQELSEILAQGLKKRQSLRKQATPDDAVISEEKPISSVENRIPARATVIDISSDTDEGEEANGTENESGNQNEDGILMTRSQPADEVIADRTQRHRTAMNVPIADLTPEDIQDMCLDSFDMSDRPRLLIKMLYDAGAPYRSRLRNLLRGGMVRFEQRLVEALKSLQEGIESAADDREADTMYTCACICMAFYLLLPKIYYELDRRFDLNEISNLIKDKDQLEQIGALIRQHISPKTDKKWTDISQQEVDDDEEDTPRARRRKNIKFNEKTINQQNAALTRQAKHDAARKRSDPDALAMLVADTNSNVQIEINPVRAEDDTAIYINNAIAKRMKPHQINGVRFLWRETTIKDEDGIRGCLLAHSMGLGKTMQTITTLLTINETARHLDDKVALQLPEHLRSEDVRSRIRHLRAMVLCPPSLINNWRSEIMKWVPRRALGEIYSLDQVKKEERLDHLNEWSSEGGILLMGYEMFSRQMKMAPSAADIDTEQELDNTIYAVLRHDAEIVVADEAHAFKNLASGINKAVMSLKAKTRIALTGTPLSNGIGELFALFSWIAPGYLGDSSQFNGYYANPIKEGVWGDCTPAQVRLSKKRLAVLRSEIEPKYLRADITTLRGMLKPKTEFLLTVTLTQQQKEAYSKFVAFLTGKTEVQDIAHVNLFAWLNTLTLLTNHPWSFRDKLLAPPPPKKKKKAKAGSSSNADADGEAITVQADQVDADNLDHRAYGLSDELNQAIIAGITDDNDANLSAKTGLFLQLLNLSIQAGDKMIVFTGTLMTLDCLVRLLEANQVKFGRLDGKTEMSSRTELIKRLEKSHLDVLLISTRAGGLGLNMQCANRVVIFDTGFNPTWEEQAIGRAYRLGQKKAVFVYRFIAGGTFEEKLENNQMFKKGLASRVIDKKDTIRQARRSIEDWLHDPREVRAEPVYEWIGKDPGVLDTILEAQRSKESSDGAGMNHIFKIRTMETLHAESDDADLDEAEKQEVAVEIEASKTKRRESARLIAQRSTQMPPAALTPRKPAAFRDALSPDGQSSKPLTPSSLSKSVLPPATSTSASASKVQVRPLSTASTTDLTANVSLQSTQRPSEQGLTTTVAPTAVSASTAKSSAQPTSTANVAPALPSQSAQRSSTQIPAKSMPPAALATSVPNASTQRAPMTPSKLSSVVSSQEPQQTLTQTHAKPATNASQKVPNKSKAPAIQADDTPPLSTDEPMTQAAAEKLLGGLSNCRMAQIFLANKLLLRRNVLALRTILEENVASRDDPDEFWRLYQTPKK